MFGNNENKPPEENGQAAGPGNAKMPMTAEQRRAVQQDANHSLKNAILNEEDLPMISANKRESVKIREDESHMMHIETTQKFHKAKEKAYDSKKATIKLNVTQFQQMELDGALGIYDKVQILHDPRSDAQIKAFEKLVEAKKPKEKK